MINEIQTGYKYLNEKGIYLAVSVNIGELSPEVIRAYNYCQEFNAISVKLNAADMILESESISISIGTDPVEVITAEHTEINVDIDVEKSGRTTLLFKGEQYKEIGHIVLFDGFDDFDSHIGCQPVKFASGFTTNLSVFANNHLLKKEGDCLVVGSVQEEVLKEIIFKAGEQLDPEQIRSLHEKAMSEIESGMTVAEAVTEAILIL